MGDVGGVTFPRGAPTEEGTGYTPATYSMDLIDGLVKDRWIDTSLEKEETQG